MARHKRAMRRLTLIGLVAVAACAPRPAPQALPSAPQQEPAADGRHDHRTLNGMTAGELMEHFGRPRLQVQEGEGTKIQFAGRRCVLDTYLYPAQGGVPRVSHVEARNLEGGDADAQNCVYSLEER